MKVDQQCLAIISARTQALFLATTCQPMHSGSPGVHGPLSVLGSAGKLGRRSLPMGLRKKKFF